MGFPLGSNTIIEFSFLLWTTFLKFSACLSVVVWYAANWNQISSYWKKTQILLYMVQWISITIQLTTTHFDGHGVVINWWLKSCFLDFIIIVIFRWYYSCLFGQQEGHLACKNWVVGCWRGCLGWGADLRIAQQMPMPLTISCSSKSRLVLTFMVLPFWYLLTWVAQDIF